MLYTLFVFNVNTPIISRQFISHNNTLKIIILEYVKWHYTKANLCMKILEINDLYVKPLMNI